MRNHDHNREKQLERLFEESRPSLPQLEAEADLPAHVRALAAARDSRREPRRGWAWLSLASAAFALSIIAGGYAGYRMWVSSHDTATQQVRDADAFSSALSQSGYADDMASNDEAQE